MMVKSGLENFFLEIPPFAHHVIFMTEFVLLIKTPHFYEANSFDRKWLEHGGISKIFFLTTFCQKHQQLQPCPFNARQKLPFSTNMNTSKHFYAYVMLTPNYLVKKIHVTFSICIKLTSFFLVNASN